MNFYFTSSNIVIKRNMKPSFCKTFTLTCILQYYTLAQTQCPSMIYEARKNAQSNNRRRHYATPLSKKRRPLRNLVLPSFVPTSACGKFSGVEMKSWEMDEILRGEKPKAIRRRIWIERTFQISHSEIGFCSADTIDSQTRKEGKEKREWEQWNQFCPFESHPQMLND